MRLREATLDDVAAIAGLHADSWRRAYRGILRDAFLDGPVIENRVAVWQQRLSTPSPDQRVQLAVDDETGEVLGFVCVFRHGDAPWGAHLDNLHVAAHAQGRGIGGRLLDDARAWAAAGNPPAGLYLWVYETNTAARGFYERHGGVHVETNEDTVPGGGTTQRCRYCWSVGV